MAMIKDPTKTQLALQAAALTQLAIIGGELTNDEDIAFEGKRFVFPEQFQGDLPGLNRFVTRYVQGQEEEVIVQQVFDYRSVDVAFSTYVCLRDYFGYAQSKARRGMFGSEPPQELTIPVGYTDGKLIKHTVPWGDMVLPGLKNATLSIGKTQDSEKGELGYLAARCRRADKPVADGFFRVVEQHLMEHSIYRGHAVYGNMEYFDVDQVDPSRFVYDEDVWAQVETNILSPMRHAQVLESYGLSPKRVVLLEGPFGTGKSALGRTAAKVAVANGWTAITARPGVDDPFLMLQTARLYQPTMLFIEDVDIFSATQNPEQVSMLLDRFDGFGNKDIRMLLVLTTNHADRIHKGMLRPGRLDAVIHIGNMDRPGVEKLCHIIVGHNLDENIDYDAVFAATSDFTPAFVKEAIERAMRYTIARTGKPGQINGDDLIHACNSLRAQLGLQEAAADSHEKLPPLDQQFREMIAQATGVDLNQLGAVTQRSVQRAMHGAALIQESNGKVSHRMHTS